MAEPAAAPLIAIVGSDGSGKSTVARALLAWLGEQRPTALCHLGKQTGNIARRVARLPVFGRRFDRAIVAKGGSLRGRCGPSSFTASCIYAFSMRRVRRFRRMVALRARGIAIVTDRFPQIVVPGKMDGPGLAGLSHRNAAVRWLAAREARHYAWMAGHVPDLVIRLNVGLDVAASRKPDHRVAALRSKIEVVPHLRFGDAPIVELDAERPIDDVVSAAKAAISRMLAARAAWHPGAEPAGRRAIALPPTFDLERELEAVLEISATETAATAPDRTWLPATFETAARPPAAHPSR